MIPPINIKYKNPPPRQKVLFERNSDELARNKRRILLVKHYGMFVLLGLGTVVLICLLQGGGFPWEALLINIPIVILFVVADYFFVRKKNRIQIFRIEVDNGKFKLSFWDNDTIVNKEFEIQKMKVIRRTSGIGGRGRRLIFISENFKLNQPTTFFFGTDEMNKLFNELSLYKIQVEDRA